MHLLPMANAINATSFQSRGQIKKWQIKMCLRKLFLIILRVVFFCACSDSCYSNWNYPLEMTQVDEIFIELGAWVHNFQLSVTIQDSWKDSSIRRNQKKRIKVKIYSLVEHKTEYTHTTFRRRKRKIMLVESPHSNVIENAWGEFFCSDEFVLFLRIACSSSVCPRAFRRHTYNVNAKQ